MVVEAPCHSVVNPALDVQVRSVRPRDSDKLMGESISEDMEQSPLLHNTAALHRTTEDSPPSRPKAQTSENAISISSGALQLRESSLAPIDLRTTVPLSQPMTVSNSSSSTTSAKESSSSAAPYGTRSRNRVSRPNYAEDREVEMDFEARVSIDQDGVQKIAHFPPWESSTDTPLIPVPIGLSSATNASKAATPKDYIPGTSTFSSNATLTATAPSYKKRKANTQSGPMQDGNSSTTNGTNSTIMRNNQASLNSPATKESFMLSFENCGSLLRNGKLVSDDGTILETNDHVYLVCEPPGEPYYLGRIMEFLHVDNDSTKAVEALRMNWYYRPKDIGRKANDTRQVFASMHSDISPLTALRGLCQIKHKSEVDNMDEYRRTQNCFWYEKLFDRYIHRYYEVIPTKQVVNVPAKVKKVLDDRWKFILVESGRGKELTSASKSCKRCNGFCASNNSVDCAVCHQTYHMNCVRPPLLKKPSRGFAWACGPCSRAQERKLEARNTPTITETNKCTDEDEPADEEEDDFLCADGEGITGNTSPMDSYEEDVPVHPGTAEQIYQASLWPFRYLGIHCKVEDALDYDDRIYPRASSRLGPRHQANITTWPGRPVQLVKPLEIRRKYVKGGSHKKDAKLSKDTLAAIEADKIARDKRPKWVMDEPPGYIARGEDHANGDPNCTAELLYKPIDSKERSKIVQHESVIDEYLEHSSEIAKKIGVKDYAVNFLDKAVGILHRANYDTTKALEELSKITKKDLKEPELTPSEVRKFEDAVAKYGSELHSVKKHVKSVSAANIVRFYYVWKKTERGKQIWGSYSGRKGKREAKKVEVAVGKLQDDVADEQDDSAFDNEKASKQGRGFVCKFCSTRISRQWRRAPNTPAGTTVSAEPSNKPPGKDKDKGAQLTVALCLSCAVVWRKYAVQWEDTDDKKSSQNGGRMGKRKAEDPLREFQLSELNWTSSNTEAANTPIGGTPAPQVPVIVALQDASKKKAKGGGEKEQLTITASDSGPQVTPSLKKKAVEKLPVPPIIPELPKPRVLPCAICFQLEPLDQHLSCKECRMAVHRNCYGVLAEMRGLSKWTCDMCLNDRSPQVSIQYKCMLCPIESTPQDFVEPAKVSHKKKTEKDREKDRLERELAIKAAEFYRKKQEELNRPVIPREALKRTANNNWVHVTCAVWTPEVKFGNAKALEPSEGIPSIPSARYDEICKICRDSNGACVACVSCKGSVHVECAHQAGYILGFEISPVKGSRRDHVNIVAINGESGSMTATIWCREHCPTKTIVHRMHDVVDTTGLTALQLFVRSFKQADLTLTGTVRKATLINLSTKSFPPLSSATITTRRASTTTVGGTTTKSLASHIKVEEVSSAGADVTKPSTSSPPCKTCLTCGVVVSPRWWPFSRSSDTSTSFTGTRQTLEIRQLGSGNDDLPQRQNNPKQQVALAAAALNEDLPKDTETVEVQCHKCHWNKILKKAPVVSNSTAEVSRNLEQNQVIQRQSLTSPSLALSSSLLSPYAPPTQPTTSSQYPWPHSTFSCSAYGDWPQGSPAFQNPNMVLHQYNGSRSPRSLSTTGQPQSHPLNYTDPRSPHMNSVLPAGTTSNGYPLSPPRNLGGRHQTQHGTFASYAPTRPASEHMTNAGPPLSAADIPFTQGNHSSFLPAFGVSQSTPQPQHDSFHAGRDAGNHSTANVARPLDHRVNGGASASPSLQNLLS